jgi:hypothetical protein
MSLHPPHQYSQHPPHQHGGPLADASDHAGLDLRVQAAGVGTGCGQWRDARLTQALSVNADGVPLGGPHPRGLLSGPWRWAGQPILQTQSMGCMPQRVCTRQAVCSRHGGANGPL